MNGLLILSPVKPLLVNIGLLGNTLLPIFVSPFLAGPPPPSGSLTIFCTINAAARAMITSRIRDKSPGDSGVFSDSSSLDCNVSLGAAVVDSSVD